MTLPDLIDLEAQLVRDAEVDPRTLGSRDRALVGAHLPSDRAALLARWLEALRDHEPGRAWPGRRVETGLRATRAVLVVLGLALGWGAATAVLRGGGSHPVNVWDFLLALVASQVLLLALLLASFFLPLAATGSPVIGLVRSAVGALVRRLAGGARGAEWRATWHRLRSRRSLYHGVEPWLLLATTQAFGVAFNVGALAAVLRLVVFSDLAFAWSTTLVDLDAGAFHALARAIAAPWAALLPSAVPSRELVEATRYSHLASTYLGPGAGRAALTAVGGWWPFLAAALVTYGLLPRLALLTLASWRARAALRRLPLDDAEVARVVRRLSEPHVETRATAPDASAPPAPVATTGSSRPADGGRAAVLVWRDAPASREVVDAAARQARCAPASPLAVDGEMPPIDAGAVLVLAESWEAPDKATLRFLRELRARAGPRLPVTVVLVDGAAPTPRAPREEELRVWREQLSTLEDPWLAVEPLEASA